ncbi:MAG: prepilin-type N-terminal cleavage/methylation domain-containing protein [Lentisphaeraceae bacterium]|nr:prepilin-type N-terminal cleavage/methylation domain-containing protein [Lentisphaeraceae bacterium]
MQSRKPFTLIELLVVVAIIALLITILLPSLKNARQAAEAAVCGSNLKQMYTGSMIQNSNTQHLPNAAYGGGQPTNSWKHTISKVMNLPSNKDSVATELYSELFDCPSYDKTKQSYMYNEFAGFPLRVVQNFEGRGNLYYPVRLAKVKVPSAAWFIGDSWRDHHLYNMGYFGEQVPRHRSKLQGGMLDGSIRQLYTPQQKTLHPDWRSGPELQAYWVSWAWRDQRKEEEEEN